MRTYHRLAVGLAGLATLAGCSGGGGGPTGYSSGGQNPPAGGQQPPSSTSNSVLVQNNKFTPSATTVPTGTTVTWTWDACSDDGYGGRTCVAHSIVFDNEASASPTQSTGTFARRFESSGTFTYHCGVHGGAMTGQVVVR
jgi:plastocyanin